MIASGMFFYYRAYLAACNHKNPVFLGFATKKYINSNP